MRDRLSRGELTAAITILILHAVALPVGLSIYVSLNPSGMTEAQMNLAYYVISLALVALFLGRYLRRSFDSLADAPFRALSSFALGWCVYMLMSIVAAYVIQAIGFDTDNLNQGAINDMLDSDRGATVAMTVFIAPVVEESLFRGGLYCGLRPKGKLLAYVVSGALFCLYHVWQYAVALGDATYLLMAVQYIPAAFVLCWVYERSGSVWTAIFFHMSVNALAVAGL